MADETLAETIRAAAAEPVSATGDEGSVTQRSISDLIAADNHLCGKETLKKSHRGLVLKKLSPPGSI